MTYIKDLFERTATVYLLAFLGLGLTAHLGVTGTGVVKSAAVAGVPAALQVFWGLLAAFKGDPATAGITDTRDHY